MARYAFDETNRPKTQQSEMNNLIGKTVAGYQVWFSASPDKESGWGHWAGRSAPARGHLSFEVYPDVSEYPDDALFETKFAPLGNGKASRLFTAKNPKIIDTQISWLSRYGIDGVAVQRFYGSTSYEYKENEKHLEMIRDAAEKYGRIFYVMYDLSGAGRDDANAFERIKGDVINNIENKGLTLSKSYAHANHKPVVCLWGLSAHEFPRYTTAEVAEKIIAWLKERGYFVIGGIPDNYWTTSEESYKNVYKMIDMASPWTPGRYDIHTADAWLEKNIRQDLDYCAKYNILYQPVVFPGFAWSNWANGTPNAFPRMAGEFIWKQISHIKKAGVSMMYMAMFDEYDEGTAYMKAAEDYFSIPTDQYFLTLAADGYWLSSDYYLRAAGAAIRVLKGQAELTEHIGIPHSLGPVYWRNSFEKRYTEYRVQGKVRCGVYPVDVCLKDPEIIQKEGARILFADVVRDAQAFTGEYCFRFTGEIQSKGGIVRFRLAPAEIAVGRELKLSYQIKADNHPGVEVKLELLFDDGSAFGRERAAAGVTGGWRSVSLVLPKEYIGRKIVGVAAAAEGKNEGRFDALIDDIIIEDA